MNFKLALALACLLLLSPVDVVGQDALVPMFPGPALDGWVLTNTPPETWSLKEGVLYCTGKPVGELRTAKMYQNFVMEVEWRHMVPGGNAGIFVWADDITARGVPFHRGIEVQVLENSYGSGQGHTTHGDIFPIHGATMTPENGRGGSRAFPTEERSKPSPEWNHYRIEGRDGAISLAVNGKLVTRGKDCVPRKGYICLESEGGVVEYRNMRIQELPGDDLPAELVAIANRGYRSLYTGLNLSGWETDDAAAWRVNDWVLSFAGEADAVGKLTSTTEFADVNFVVDVRLQAATSNAIIKAGPAFAVDLSDPAIAAQLVKQGGWNRIEGNAADKQQWLEINGQRIPLQTKQIGTSGKFVLETKGPVDFCNVYVREPF